MVLHGWPSLVKTLAIRQRTQKSVKICARSGILNALPAAIMATQNVQVRAEKRLRQILFKNRNFHQNFFFDFKNTNVV